MPLPSPLAPIHCRWCRLPLAPLERFRGDTCRRLPCTVKTGRERQQRQADADLALRRRRAAARGADEALAQAPVIWLQPNGTRLVPLAPALRQAQAQHLAALAAALRAAPIAEPGEPPPESPNDVGDRLCGFCRGRCCRYGLDRHGFVTTELLARWLRRHPGATPEDAAADYLRRVPARHVENSCVHHGAQGCTLPREMRSDICNTYACDGLVETQQRSAGDGLPHGVVAAMPGAGGVGRAAWVQADQARPLPRRPR